jgi:hypothetical protein
MPEAFVYITLPGSVELVTAGRFVMETDGASVPVGRLVPPLHMGRGAIPAAGQVPAASFGKIR